MVTEDVNVDSSATEGDNQADSPNANDVNSSSSEQNEKFVPYDRFKEVVDQRNESDKKLDDLSNDFNELKNRLSPQAPSQEEEIPDPYEDPKAFAEHTIQKAVDRINSEKAAKAQIAKDADAYVENQFKEIEKTEKGIDREKLSGFADEYGIRGKDGKPDLIKAHSLMTKMGQKDDTARANFAPSGQSSQTVGQGKGFNPSWQSVDDIISSAVS